VVPAEAGENDKKKQKRTKQGPVGEAPNGDWWVEKDVAVTGAEVTPAKTFADAGFPKRLRNALADKFAEPTPIQAAAWPLLMSGMDAIGVAKTGSGKTLAFALPFLARSELGEFETWKQPSNKPRMVVLAPTRELVQQIATVITEFAALASKVEGRYPVVTIVGGMPKRDQCQQIRTQGADIVCGTVGRLLDLATTDYQALDLSCVQMFCLDEADRMLDMGFVDDVKRIAGFCPASRQTVLFSATWPRAVHRLAKSLTRTDNTATITVGARKGKAQAKAAADENGEEASEGDIDVGEGRPVANDKITQKVEVMYNPKAKLPRLIELLGKHREKKIIIFALYKKEAATLERLLQQRGFPEIVALQGDMTQTARYEAMDAFKTGKTKLLVATDVASRGLDVKDIGLVINYTFPLTIEDYVHRIGRTARGDKSGSAITFFNGGPADGVQDEKSHAGDLVRVLQQTKQEVPADLAKLAGSSGGNKATKKKAHPIYGMFFKDEAEMAKLEAKKTHVTFDNSDDEN